MAHREPGLRPSSTVAATFFEQALNTASRPRSVSCAATSSKNSVTKRRCVHAPETTTCATMRSHTFSFKRRRRQAPTPRRRTRACSVSGQIPTDSFFVQASTAQPTSGSYMARLRLSCHSTSPVQPREISTTTRSTRRSSTTRRRGAMPTASVSLSRCSAATRAGGERSPGPLHPVRINV